MRHTVCYLDLIVGRRSRPEAATSPTTDDPCLSSGEAVPRPLGKTGVTARGVRWPIGRRRHPLSSVSPLIQSHISVTPNLTRIEQFLYLPISLYYKLYRASFRDENLIAWEMASHGRAVAIDLLQIIE